MEKLLEILNKVKPEVDFTSSNDLVDDGILDSIDIVSIISEIESEYGIEINPDEIDPDNFKSASAILGMIEKAIKWSMDSPIQLFILPFAGSRAAQFDEFVSDLGENVETYTIEYAGRGKRAKEQYYTDYHFFFGWYIWPHKKI